MAIRNPTTGNNHLGFESNKAMSNKLHVGNLAFETTETQLGDLFGEAGTVSEATLVQDRATGQPRGFGFVTMSSPGEAAEVIRRFHGKDLNGRPLNITIARPREERLGGGPRTRFSPRR